MSNSKTLTTYRASVQRDGIHIKSVSKRYNRQITESASFYKDGRFSVDCRIMQFVIPYKPSDYEHYDDFYSFMIHIIETQPLRLYRDILCYLDKPVINTRNTIKQLIMLTDRAERECAYDNEPMPSYKALRSLPDNLPAYTSWQQMRHILAQHIDTDWLDTHYESRYNWEQRTFKHRTDQDVLDFVSDTICTFAAIAKNILTDTNE